MWLHRRARSVDGMNMQPHIVRSKLAVVGLAVASLAVPAPSSAGQVRLHSGACYGSAWQHRFGGISEMVSCGSHGVSGARAQFVKAVTRPVDPGLGASPS
jgi:hypothetical protein